MSKGWKLSSIALSATRFGRAQKQHSAIRLWMEMRHIYTPCINVTQSKGFNHTTVSFRYETSVTCRFDYFALYCSAMIAVL
jgi:hypothetical protein